MEAIASRLEAIATSNKKLPVSLHRTHFRDALWKKIQDETLSVQAWQGAQELS